MGKDIDLYYLNLTDSFASAHASTPVGLEYLNKELDKLGAKAFDVHRIRIDNLRKQREEASGLLDKVFTSLSIGGQKLGSLEKKPGRHDPLLLVVPKGKGPQLFNEFRENAVLKRCAKGMGFSAENVDLHYKTREERDQALAAAIGLHGDQ